jgi:sialate O-acetylesterase
VNLRLIPLAIFIVTSNLLPLAWAAPSLPQLISDHAVFQQDQKIHIWGNADPGEEIKVDLAQSAATVHAGPDGHWSVELPPRHAGGPFTLRVAGKRTLVVKDILIGEVWVASGQSNMTFELASSAGAEKELPKADYPELRLFTVPKRIASSAQSDTLPASWQACTPESAKEFSAVAYYFAKSLHNRLHVPIGIIASAWPGTSAEDWIASDMRHDPEIKSILDIWDKTEGKGFVGSRQPFDLQFDDFDLLADPVHGGTSPVLSNFDDGTAQNTFGGYWSYDLKPAPETIFELVAPGRDGKGFAAHVAGKVDASDDARLRLRYHQDLSPVDLTGYSGIRFWARGEGVFRFISLQPTISDWDDYASGLIQATPEWSQITISFRNLRQEGWGVREEFTHQSLTGLVLECFPASGYPVVPASGLYNGMIAPLLAYSFRGVVWYQGESNALRADKYETLLSGLIQSWRDASHQPDMQFLIVQLPNHGAIPQQPTESAWAELRQAQLLTAKKVPNVGLVVAIDLGDPNDLHPHRKAEIGQRLALWALGTTYHEGIVHSGPIYESMSVEGNQIRIRFSNIGTGLVSEGGGPLRGFAIAGKDRKFHWAVASIDGNSVVVSSTEVVDPAAVRYAWADSPECNLFNAEGLPASPFRTDNWPFAAHE